MKSVELTREQDIEWGRVKLALLGGNDAFIAGLILSLRTYFSEDLPTAGTDGVRLYINPKFFFDELNDKDERIFVVCHEAWHIALNHIEDRGTRLHDVWNAAGDYVINIMLRNSGKTVPRDIEILLKDKYEGWSTEKVYQDLMKKGKNKAEKIAQSNGLNGDMMPPPPPSDGQSGEGDQEGDQQGGGGKNIPDVTPSEKAQVAEVVQRSLHAAAEAAKANGFGALPGDLKALIEEKHAPKLHWRDLLSQFLSERAKDDFSWQKPNRRYLSQGFFLPSLYSEAMGSLGIAWDISGSVSDDEVSYMLTELRSVVSLTSPSETTLVTFDTQVKDIYRFEKEDTIPDIEITGRGGTDLYDMMEYFRNNPVEVLVVFSDFDCGEFDEIMPFPVIYIRICNGWENQNVTNPNGSILDAQIEEREC